MREGERVTPLELFFDLVFVLALTECTTLMASGRVSPGLGVAEGLAALAVLWWAWVGYAWLTSVVDPEEGAVRLVIFAAMAAMLVAAMYVPRAFGDAALLFACAYAVVRGAHIMLFLLASREDAALRHSVLGLAGSTAIGVALLILAAFSGGVLRGVLWGLAVVLDAGGPFLFGAEGWRLVPGHFAERHGLIVLIALGESIVALGIGAQVGVEVGVVLAAVLGVAVAAALWWTYFDVVAIVAERHLAGMAPGREQNELARDSYSYLHFLMVAGIALIALGLRRTLDHVGDPLGTVPTAALLGGAATYLLAHVGFRLRNLGTLNRQRLFCALLLVALVPAVVALKLPSLATLAILAAILASLILYEALRFAEARDRVRHGPVRQ
ncbi:MAG TPA: low temperature requirement protein A [Solirubrobacteraceae bacterium]|jgi:low temperature requirement protein LtrA|nr:low temperature requirement protein A [Solirubrobacteraceae bacterium]